LKAGVPRAKITLGLPFYGRGWGNVGKENNGLYQATTKMARGIGDSSAYTYKNLVENYIEKAGYQRYWNDEAKVPWLYNPTERIFITYEDAESISYKAAYVVIHQLGGAMIWHLSSDDGTLLKALYTGLATPAGTPEPTRVAKDAVKP
jgi:chitinase